MTPKLASVLDWFRRSALLVGVSLAVLLLLGSAAGVAIGTVLQIILFECIAIVLSSLAVYVFTCISFIKQGDTNALSKIFLAVHLLVGLCVLGIYFVQWTPVGP